MAGGWFFLITTKAFTLGKQDFRVPGIGAYMSVAMDLGDVRAQIFGIIAMGVIIVVVDRLVWWPLVVWSRRFKLDDFAGVSVTPSPFQLWIARSRFAAIAGDIIDKLRRRFLTLPARPVAEKSPPRLPRRPPEQVYGCTVFLSPCFLSAWLGVE